MWVWIWKEWMVRCVNRMSRRLSLRVCIRFFMELICTEFQL